MSIIDGHRSLQAVAPHRDPFNLTPESHSLLCSWIIVIMLEVIVSLISCLQKVFSVSGPGW